MNFKIPSRLIRENHKIILGLQPRDKVAMLMDKTIKKIAEFA